VKDKSSLRRFFDLCSLSKKESVNVVLPREKIRFFIPDNGAKKMLFLSLYFKALKYTVKASEKIEGAKNRIKTDKKVKAIVGFSTVSVETPSFPGY
jgi:hypothetical protein